jgi:hypothetical protein
LGDYNYNFRSFKIFLLIKFVDSIISFNTREQNIWFYPLSYFLVFIIYSTRLYYLSEKPIDVGFISIKFYSFSDDFPYYLYCFLLYFIPALIYSIGYRRIVKRKMKTAKMKGCE